jgi:hypothetical protein
MRHALEIDVAEASEMAAGCIVGNPFCAASAKDHNGREVQECTKIKTNHVRSQSLTYEC